MASRSSTKETAVAAAADEAAPEAAPEVESPAEEAAAPAAPRTAQDRLNELLDAGYRLSDLVIVTTPDGSLKSVSVA